MNLEQELKSMNEQIISAQEQKAQSEGRLEQILSQLQTDFGTSDIDKAKKMLQKKIEEKEMIERTLKEDVRKLKEDGEWDF